MCANANVFAMLQRRVNVTKESCSDGVKSVSRRITPAIRMNESVTRVSGCTERCVVSVSTITTWGFTMVTVRALRTVSEGPETR